MSTFKEEERGGKVGRTFQMQEMVSRVLWKHGSACINVPRKRRDQRVQFCWARDMAGTMEYLECWMKTFRFYSVAI